MPADRYRMDYRQARYQPYPSTGRGYRVRPANPLSIARAILPAVATGGMYAAKSAYNYVRGRKTIPSMRRGSQPRGTYKKAKSAKKVNSIDRKPKINKKFMKKVLKVMNYTEVYGKISFTGFIQVRSTTHNRWSYNTTDFNSKTLSFFTPNDVLNCASCIFNGKTLDDNNSLVTNNFDSRIKIHIKSYNIRWYLRSTSSHICRVEFYTCIAKDENTTDVGSDLIESYADYVSSSRSATGAVSNQFEMPSASPDEWIELTKNWKVSKRTMVLQPGQSTAFNTRICGNYIYDLSKKLNNNVIIPFAKGTRGFFFRVINEPSVGGTTGQVARFQSNVQGGVAVEFTRVFKCAPPAATTEANNRNTIRHYTSYTDTPTGADQQVAYQNPTTTTAVG